MNLRLAFLLASALPLVIAGCSPKDESRPEDIRPLMSMVVTERPAGSLRLAGVVQPRIQAELGFRVLGRITRRDVNIGDLVTRGQVIASIDPLALELAVRSGQADLSNAEAQLANASVIEQRQSKLAQSSSGSQSTLENAQQANESAKAQVAKARANLAKANDQLGYAQLHAEFDGVVTGVSAEIGQVVSAGQTAITIARPDLRDVVADVPEDRIAGLKKGAPFDVMLQLDPGIRATGTVREIAPEAEATTRTRRIKITLSDPPEAFRLGTIVTVAATTDASPTISLPPTAILREGEQASVWLVDPKTGTVSKKPVKIGTETDTSVVIASGVQTGDRVAVAGVHSLHEGQQVRIDQENKL